MVSFLPMTEPLPLDIEVTGVGAVDMVKDLGQIGTGCFQKNRKGVKSTLDSCFGVL